MASQIFGVIAEDEVSNALQLCISLGVVDKAGHEALNIVLGQLLIEHFLFKGLDKEGFEFVDWQVSVFVSISNIA